MSNDLKIKYWDFSHKFVNANRKKTVGDLVVTVNTYDDTYRGRLRFNFLPIVPTPEWPEPEMIADVCIKLAGFKEFPELHAYLVGIYKK